MVGHSEISTWIVVMLTTGHDCPDASPAARAQRKLNNKDTGELIPQLCLDKVSSVSTPTHVLFYRKAYYLLDLMAEELCYPGTSALITK